MSAAEIAAIAGLVTALQVGIVAIIGASKAKAIKAGIDGIAERILLIEGYVVTVPADPNEPARIRGKTVAESADIIGEMGTQGLDTG